MDFETRIRNLPKAFNTPADYKLDNPLLNTQPTHIPDFLSKTYGQANFYNAYNNPQTYGIQTHHNGFYSAQNFHPYRQQFAFRPKNTPIRLDECPQNQIIFLSKNRVVKEEVFRVPVAESTVFPHKQLLPQTRRQLNQPQQESAKNSSQNFINDNDRLFNADKIVADRRERKKQFLNSIEEKLLAIQKEAGGIEEHLREEQRELGEMELINYKVNKDIKDHRINNKICRLNEQVQKEIAKQNEKQRQRDIHAAMTAHQINEVLDEVYKDNDELFKQIEEVTRGVASQQIQYSNSGNIKTTDQFKNTATTNKESNKHQNQRRTSQKAKQVAPKKNLVVGFNSTMKKA